MCTPSLFRLALLAAFAYGGACGSPSSTTSCPDFCPLAMAPVCGSDGITYNTACDLARERCSNGAKKDLSIAAIGRCGVDCAMVCPDDEAPVCGSDYKTYKNKCELQRAQCRSGDVENPELVSYSACVGGPAFPGADGGDDGGLDGGPIFMPSEVDDDPLPMPSDVDGDLTDPTPTLICPTSSTPVCGSDGKTYDNLCQIAVAHHDNPTIWPIYRGSCTDKPTAPLLIDLCGLSTDL